MSGTEKPRVSPPFNPNAKRVDVPVAPIPPIPSDIADLIPPPRVLRGSLPGLSVVLPTGERIEIPETVVQQMRVHGGGTLVDIYATHLPPLEEEFETELRKLEFPDRKDVDHLVERFVRRARWNYDSELFSGWLPP